MPTLFLDTFVFLAQVWISYIKTAFLWAANLGNDLKCLWNVYVYFIYLEYWHRSTLNLFPWISRWLFFFFVFGMKQNLNSLLILSRFSLLKEKHNFFESFLFPLSALTSKVSLDKEVLHFWLISFMFLKTKDKPVRICI